MKEEVVKILRLVEKGSITKEQGFILIKALYDKVRHEDFSYADYDNSALTTEAEEAIDNVAELIQEYIEALEEREKGGQPKPEGWQMSAFEQSIAEMVRQLIGNVLTPDTEEPEAEPEADNDNFVKKDYYLAGEKVYEQRNVSLKSIRKGKTYKANFFVYEIMDSEGKCIPEEKLRKLVLGLIDEKFCGRYRKIKNGNVRKVYIE